MKLLYVVYTKIPTVKAHGIQIAKMCDEFAGQGMEVELLTARSFSRPKEGLFDYYQLKNKFKVSQFLFFNPRHLGRLNLLIKITTFFFFVLPYILFKKADVIYIRGIYYCYLLSLFKNNFYLELHSAEGPNFLMRRILKKSRGIIAITQGIKDICTNNYLIPPAKIFVAPDGVDLKKFDINISCQQARKKLSLPLDKKIIIYAGSFYIYDWKGIDVLLEAVQYFSSDHLFILVGGKEKEIKQIKEKYNLDNILLVAQKAHSQIPYYLKAADVLVIPNKKGDSISEKYTSPLKMFEYMASQRPIVASDLPSIREVLNENNAVLVEPSNPQSLAQGMKIVLSDSILAQHISQRALRDVQPYTWEKRAGGIVGFIRGTL